MNKFILIMMLSTILPSCGVKGDLHLPGQKPQSHKKVINDNTGNATNSTNPDNSSDNQENTDK